MSWNRWALLAAVLISLPSAPTLSAQERKGRIDVESYIIDAEINPAAQTLKATVQVRFTPLDDVNVATFELNNALNVSKVTDAAGRQIPASRNPQEFTIRLSFPEQPAQGQAGDRHVRLRRQTDGRRFAGLRHQVRRHQERLLLPDVSGALVPGERVHHRPLHDGYADHGAAGLHGDRAGEHRRLGPDRERLHGLSLQVHAAVVSRPAWRWCRASRRRCSRRA